MTVNNSTFELGAQYQLKPMRIVDVEAVVRVHMSSFKNFFLTFLGPSFLKELYLGTVNNPSGISIVAEFDGSICGFVTGTVATSGFYRQLIRHQWWRFGLACVLPIIKCPIIVPRLLRAFSMPRQTANKQCRCTLMSIGVHIDIQGKGIGKALVLEFLREAAQRGVKQVALTTDAVDNEAVNCFYAELGFVCERVFLTPEGREMREWVYFLEDSDISDNAKMSCSECMV